MPRQNRVLPTGEIVASAARGAWMGNRGCLHDRSGRIVRRWASSNWLICQLDFRGRRRALMSPGRYTELFFLDEATALAAGHRPCFECRRADFRRFAQAWLRGRRLAHARASDIDTVLHRERRVSGEDAGELCATAELPNGTMIERVGQEGAWLLHRGLFWRWTAHGYCDPQPQGGERVRCITPAGTIAAMREGYSPEIHATALKASL
jgi:hypothetical protein